MRFSQIPISFLVIQLLFTPNTADICSKQNDMKTTITIALFFFLNLGFSQSNGENDRDKSQLEVLEFTEASSPISSEAVKGAKLSETTFSFSSMNEGISREIMADDRAVKNQYSKLKSYKSKKQGKLSKRNKVKLIFAGTGILAALLVTFLLTILGITLFIGLIVIYLFFFPIW